MWAMWPGNGTARLISAGDWSHRGGHDRRALPGDPRWPAGTSGHRRAVDGGGWARTSGPTNPVDGGGVQPFHLELITAGGDCAVAADRRRDRRRTPPPADPRAGFSTWPVTATVHINRGTCAAPVSWTRPAWAPWWASRTGLRARGGSLALVGQRRPDPADLADHRASVRPSRCTPASWTPITADQHWQAARLRRTRQRRGNGAANTGCCEAVTPGPGDSSPHPAHPAGKAGER